MKKIIKTDSAPAAIGPYSQAVAANGFVFVSGQIPIDPTTNQIIEGDIVAQTHQVIKNLKAVLAAAGTSLQNAVKTTVFLADMSDFGRMNEVYGTYFKECPPARATVQAARLPKDVQIEIDIVAVVQ